MKHWPDVVLVLVAGFLVCDTVPGPPYRYWLTRARLPGTAANGDNPDRSMLALLGTLDFARTRILVPQTRLPPVHDSFPQARLAGEPGRIR